MQIAEHQVLRDRTDGNLACQADDLRGFLPVDEDRCDAGFAGERKRKIMPVAVVQDLPAGLYPGRALVGDEPDVDIARSEEDRDAAARRRYEMNPVIVYVGIEVEAEGELVGVGGLGGRTDGDQTVVQTECAAVAALFDGDLRRRRDGLGVVRRIAKAAVRFQLQQQRRMHLDVFLQCERLAVGERNRRRGLIHASSGVGVADCNAFACGAVAEAPRDARVAKVKPAVCAEDLADVHVDGQRFDAFCGFVDDIAVVPFFRGIVELCNRRADAVGDAVRRRLQFVCRRV